LGAGLTLRAGVGAHGLSSEGLSDAMLSYSDAVDAVMAKLESRLPQAEPKALRRLVFLSLESAAITWGRLATHEAGHVLGAQTAGAKAHIEQLGLTQGLSRLEGPANRDHYGAFLLGGLNQSESHRSYLHKESARKGELSLGNALTAISTALDDTLYIATTWRDAQKGATWQYADPANMRRFFAQTGRQVSYEHLLAKAFVADALSSLTWDALTTAYQYIKTGDRTQARAQFELLGAQILGPDTSLLRSAYGDSFRVESQVHTSATNTWEVRLDLRTHLDNWNLNAVGVRLQKLDAARIEALNLTVSPYIGVATRVSDQNPAGLALERRLAGELGFEFSARPHNLKHVEIVGRVGYGNRGWDGAATAKADIDAYVGVRLSF